MINDDLEMRATSVSNAISTFLPIAHPEMLYKASRYVLDEPGKRIGSSMLLLAGEAVGGNPMNLIPASVCIEMIQGAVIIHDDILDNSKIRHGLPTVHTLWNESKAIVAGDALFAHAFKVLNLVKAESGLKLAALNILAEACTTINEGQWLDLNFMDQENVSEEEYLEMIGKKTGAFFSASASIGAVLSGGSAKEIEGLEQFGRLTGIGFQLHDDILDITESEDRIGKKYGGDVIEGKKTLIMIHALDHGIKVDAFGKKDATPQEIDQAQSILQDCGSIDFARAKAAKFIEGGKKALDVLPESDAKSILLDLADFMIGRTYKGLTG